MRPTLAVVLLALTACSGGSSEECTADCTPDTVVTPPSDALPLDADADGFVAASEGGDDCDDARADVNPDQVELEEWEFELVGPAMSWMAPSLAVGSDGEARVMTTSSARGGLYEVRHAARNTDGTWTATTLIPETNSGGGPLVIDDAGASHTCIVRYSPTLGVDHWTDASGVWVREELADGQLSCSLAIGDDGLVHAVTSGAQGLEHLWRTDEAWEHEAIAPITDAYSDLVQAPDGSWGVAYKRQSRSELGFASSPSAGVWDIAPVDLVESGVVVVPSVAFDASGVVHIGAGDGDGAVLHATDDGTGFTVETVGMGDDAAFALDEATGGRFVFSRDGQGLVYAMPSESAPSGWETILLAPPADGARGSDIVIRDGVVHIAYPTYGDGTEGNLMYARRSVEDAVDQDCDGNAL